MAPTFPIEVGVRLPAAAPAIEGFAGSATPAGLAATTVPWGPYEQLAAAHATVRTWCRDRGAALTGRSWEIYGHHREEPSERRTDVFWLLA